MVKTFTLFINRNLNNDEFNNLMNYVSVEKRQRILKFRNFEDQQRSLLGDILARFSICLNYGLKNENLIFRKNDYGKPFFIAPDEFHFNISHAGHWVVCALDSHPVGIDVEVIKPIDFKIVESFFSKDEYFAFSNQDNKEKLKYFYNLWTLKESYIKAEGKGLSIPLDSFSIVMNNNTITVQGCSQNKNYFFKNFLLDNNSIFAICALNSEFGERIDYKIECFLKEVMFLL